MTPSLEALIKEFEQSGAHCLLREKDPTYGEENRRANQELRQLIIKAHAAGKQEAYEEMKKIIPEETKRPAVLSKYEDTYNEGRENGWNECRSEILSNLEALKEKK